MLNPWSRSERTPQHFLGGKPEWTFREGGPQGAPSFFCNVHVTIPLEHHTGLDPEAIGRQVYKFFKWVFSANTLNILSKGGGGIHLGWLFPRFYQIFYPFFPTMLFPSTPYQCFLAIELGEEALGVSRSDTSEDRDKVELQNSPSAELDWFAWNVGSAILQARCTSLSGDFVMWQLFCIFPIIQILPLTICLPTIPKVMPTYSAQDY